MKKITFLACILAFTICTLHPAFSQTSIPGGNISGHWTLAGSPYNIMGSVIIPTLSTLTIDPGVTVSFQTSFGLTMVVQGRLLAIGTPADSVTFTASDTTVGFSGIKFADSYYYTGNDTSKFIYCKIQYGKATGNTYLSGNGGALLFDNWSNAIISHCLITHCQAGLVSVNGNGNGGAIFCDSSSSPVISYNTISYNSTSSQYISYGAGISCSDSSSPVISYNTISYNSSNSSTYGGDGGGIYCYNSSPVISNNTISYNNGGGGGGIGCDGIGASNSAMISYNTISYNYATFYGGGIYCTNITIPSINNNNIVYNSDGYSNSFGGGGIYCVSSIISSINNNNISYNSTIGDNTGKGGGGIYCDGTSISSMSYNVISNNSSANGGGIFCFNGSNIDSISNTTIINNSALGATGNGGGFYCSGTSPSPVMINVTIANNYASNFGGALFCDVAALPNLYNCILWGDTASGIGGGNEMFQNDNLSAASFYYCNVQGGKSAFGLGPNFYTGTYFSNINSNPMFVSQSAAPGIAYDGMGANWKLKTGSPCIDSGDPLSPYQPYPSKDLGDSARTVICRVDMGAYENQYGISSPLHVNISGSSSICIYDSTKLTASGTNTYTWSPSLGLSRTNIANPVANPTVTTTYTVVGASGICEAMDTITIIVKQLPSVTFSGNDTTCQGTPTTVIASGGGTYLWSNSSTADSINVNPASTKTYSVVVTSNGCIKDSIFKLTVNLLPVLSIKTSNTNPDTLTVSGAQAYVWSTGSNYDTTIVYQSGTYYITATDSNGCVSQDSSIVVITGVLEINNNISGISVYPVPSNGNMSVLLNGNGYLSMKIVDELGREIYNRPIDSGKQEQNLTINMGGVPNGIYMMQILSKQGVISKRVVVER